MPRKLQPREPVRLFSDVEKRLTEFADDIGIRPDWLASACVLQTLAPLERGDLEVGISFNKPNEAKN